MRSLNNIAAEFWRLTCRPPVTDVRLSRDIYQWHAEIETDLGLFGQDARSQTAAIVGVMKQYRELHPK